MEIGLSITAIGLLFFSLSDCDCDLVGSINSTCNEHGGQCFCKDGVMGRQCDQCMSGYFNLTNSGCQSMIYIVLIKIKILLNDLCHFSLNYYYQDITNTFKNLFIEIYLIVSLKNVIVTSKAQKILSAQGELDSVYVKKISLLALATNVKIIIMDLALSRAAKHVTVM